MNATEVSDHEHVEPSGGRAEARNEPSAKQDEHRTVTAENGGAFIISEEPTPSRDVCHHFPQSFSDSTSSGGSGRGGCRNVQRKASTFDSTVPSRYAESRRRRLGIINGCSVWNADFDAIWNGDRFWGANLQSAGEYWSCDVDCWSCGVT
ncbi:unnamed protein product [Zymoseptoria tritici ST99CH_1E4]|uniref:Uncharacterized protein n=1 Tax=Zymoseptoria tritici ST99CH_1E4 TaxID=1276532 RepID=A0A2H1H9C0_ZYMTR|nr:unnamed protein product [Zymoseptoria tritici ST99CH_1E4]